MKYTCSYESEYIKPLNHSANTGSCRGLRPFCNRLYYQSYQKADAQNTANYVLVKISRCSKIVEKLTETKLY